MLFLNKKRWQQKRGVNSQPPKTRKKMVLISFLLKGGTEYFGVTHSKKLFALQMLLVNFGGCMMQTYPLPIQESAICLAITMKLYLLLNDGTFLLTTTSTMEPQVSGRTKPSLMYTIKASVLALSLHTYQ